MSITSGALSKSFVVVSDTAPASPFEGQLWRDTNNDVLKQWDGTTWVSVQISPDDSSIVKNSNGNLSVEKPSDIYFGRWENGDDSWSIRTGSGYGYISAPDSTRAYEGSNSIYLNCDNGDNGTIDDFEVVKTGVDISSLDNISVWVYCGTMDGNSGARANFWVENSSGSIIDSAGTDLTSWTELNVDVSGASETEATLVLKTETFNSLSEFWADKCISSKSKRVLEDRVD